MQEIQWSPAPVSDEPSQNALLALKAAAVAAKNFDKTFVKKETEREVTVALLYAQEIIIDATCVQHVGYYRDVAVKAIPLRLDFSQGNFGGQAQMARERLADRVAESPTYCCKFLQQGLVDQPDHGATAAAEMIMEVKLLMNLEPHPHISQIYACNAKGIDAFLDKGFHSFFFVTDRLEDTLAERMDQIWRRKGASMNERLEVGLDISSGLRFLHDRKIVYYLRPDKVGFDLRHNGRVKLCNFSQARQEGMKQVASSITKSDDVVHTLAYTAPEVLCKAPITCSSDVYAFAILIWEIITLRRPFDGYDRFHHYSRAVQAHERPSLDSVSSSNLKELLSTAWHPHLRPTMKTLNKVLETMLLSDNPDDAAINLSELLGKKHRPQSEPVSPSSVPRRPARSMSKTRTPAENSTRSTRSVRSNKSSASESPVKRVSYERAPSLNKLTINDSRSQPGPQQSEETSVETSPTVDGSTGTTTSAGYENTYISPVGQRGRISRNLVSQNSPASSYSGNKMGAAKNSIASGTSRSDDSSASSPGGTFSDDVPWKTIKTPKVFPRRNSTSNMRNVVQGEAWLSHDSQEFSPTQSPPLPNPSPRRRQHRSASMDFAPKSTFEDYSPVSSPPYESPNPPGRTAKQKSKRRASLSNPPSTEFKLDMVPEPTPLQRKKPSAAGFGSPCTGFMGLDNVGSPKLASVRKAKTTGSPPTPTMRTTDQKPGSLRREKSPSLKGTARGKSPGPVKSDKPLMSSGGVRRRPSMRKSSSGRDILSSPPFGNSPGSDEDGSPAVRENPQPQRALRKASSRRKIHKEGNSTPQPDDEHARRPGEGRSGLARDIVSDDDMRESFTARLRAEMMKKDPSGGSSGNGKIRVKVKSKKPSIL